MEILGRKMIGRKMKRWVPQSMIFLPFIFLPNSVQRTLKRNANEQQDSTRHCTGFGLMADR
ncbi:MAG: hypothetical protein ACI8W8_002239 [Rhodothermales bacterium]|jgi:hypothetical protein